MQNHTSEYIAPLRVGIVGYSAQSFDRDYARAILINQLRSLKIKEGRNIEVVSGLTWLGIPGLAYEVATALDLRTVGIACKKARNYECFPCDEVFLIGEDWGQESDMFLSSIDMLIRIGGGKQSHAECARAKAKGIPVVEFELATLTSVDNLANAA